MRPKGHARYDFDEEHRFLLLQDGRQKYKSKSGNKALENKKRRAGSIILSSHGPEGQRALIKMLDADWLQGEAKKEAERLKAAQ